MRTSSLLWPVLLAQNAIAITIDTTSAGKLMSVKEWQMLELEDTNRMLYADSIKSAASTVAHGLLTFYNGNETVCQTLRVLKSRN
jgi:mannan endo-1,6-alpha-mannosidase